MSKISKITENTAPKNKPIEHTISIGGITYSIVSHFSDTSTDSVMKKIERLIKRDVSAS